MPTTQPLPSPSSKCWSENEESILNAYCFERILYGIFLTALNSSNSLSPFLLILDKFQHSWVSLRKALSFSSFLSVCKKITIIIKLFFLVTQLIKESCDLAVYVSLNIKEKSRKNLNLFSFEMPFFILAQFHYKTQQKA